MHSRFFGLAAIGLGVVSATVNPVSAQPRNDPAGAPYGCACLHNKTESTVKFRYKWGNTEWKDDYLRAGYQQTMCWRYAQGSTTSPPLAFQFDVDLTKGAAWTTYDLPRVQANGNKCEDVAQKFHYDVNYRPNTNKQFLTVTHR